MGAERMALHFGGNDYLDLARHPEVREAIERAVREHGASTCASRVSVGTIELHRDLERQFADLLGCEDAVVLSSGYLASLAAFDSIGGAVDSPVGSPAGAASVVVDSGAHPSLVAGARAAGYAVRRYRRHDADHLLALLDSEPGVVAVATEGVDGFRGEIAPVGAVHATARRHGLPVVVDDAHGVGTFGPDLRGTCAELGVTPGADVVVAGSLGKAFGSLGGFVAGDRERMDRLRGGPTFTGSTALSPAALAAAQKALEILSRDPARRERLSKLSRQLRRGLEDLGAPLLGKTVGDTTPRCGDVVPVCTLDLGDPHRAAALAARLADDGVVVAYFKYASSDSSSKLRIPLSCRHREADVERLLTALRKIL